MPFINERHQNVDPVVSYFSSMQGVRLVYKRQQFQSSQHLLSSVQTNPDPYFTGKRIEAGIFTSEFECGNLEYAFRHQKPDDEEYYSLFLQRDYNSQGHQSWFYFQATLKPFHNYTFVLFASQKDIKLHHMFI